MKKIIFIVLMLISSLTFAESGISVYGGNAPNMMASFWNTSNDLDLGIEGILGTHKGGLLSVRKEINDFGFILSAGIVNYKSDFGSDTDNIISIGASYKTVNGKILIRGFQTKDNGVSSFSYTTCEDKLKHVVQECKDNIVYNRNEDKRNIIMIGMEWGL